MKRLKAFLIIVCCLLSMMSLSLTASAGIISAGTFLYGSYCPLCNQYCNLTVISFREATAAATGFIAVSCPECGRSFSRATRYWHYCDQVVLNSFGFGDVFRRYCSVHDKHELAVCSGIGDFDSNRLSIRYYAHDETDNSGGGFSLYFSHDWREQTRISATCTSSGSISLFCYRCYEPKTQLLPALGHDYITTRTDPTCTTPGSIVSTCSRCQDVQTEPIPALDHDWQEAVRADPTCTTPGSITSTCSRCQDTQTETLLTLYHSWESGEIVPSTYDEDGSLVTEGYTFYNCSSCGSSFTAVAGSSPPDSGAVPGGIGGEGVPDTTAALGKTFLSGIWSLFAIGVPGFGFTFGQMWLGVLLASLSILVVRIIFGFGGGPRGDSPRTSSTNNPRISKERRHDEY